MTPDPIIPSLPQDLESALVRAESEQGPFKRRILWFPVVPSTNDMAAALAERGAEEGCVVIADAQSAGRHERLPAEDVRSILFTLFAQRQHWSLRELIQETNQPPVRPN